MSSSDPPAILESTFLRSTDGGVGDARVDNTSETRRVLFISYAFPPTGGGGVQRSVKFVKYLPQFGWQPTVLTAANPSVPVQDPDLDLEVSPDIDVVRARTLEPGYRVKAKLGDANGSSDRSSIRTWLRRIGMQLLQPDPQILWNPAARRKATGWTRRHRQDAIYVTGPPFSSFLLGRTLKRRLGIPLIVDFRDEWMLASQHLDNYSLGRFSRRRQLRMMQSVLRSADAVITTTKASATEIMGHARHCGARPIVRCIYNGYDPDDIGAAETKFETSERLRIVYTGTLWKLTDIQPLVSALQKLATVASDAAKRVELELAGRRTPLQDAIVRQLESTPVTVRCRDYLPHNEAIQLARRADVLLLLLADRLGTDRVVPAKLFEYMALGKPILAICPKGETEQLLREHGHLHRFAVDQTSGIASWIHSQLMTGRQERMCRIDPAVEAYSRRNLTGQLAGLLDHAVDQSGQVPVGNEAAGQGGLRSVA